MLVYWTMFAVPAFSAVLGEKRRRGVRQTNYLYALLLLAFAVIIGFRYEVGGDWFNYEEIVDYIRYESLFDAMAAGDPAFNLITWISTRIGFGATGPSVFCGAVLVYGLWRFGQELTEPWLALTAAVPYLIIVVGMGYVRQSAAIGFTLLALIHFERGSFGHFGKWMILATLFHVSAIIVLPLAVLALVRKHPSWFVPLTFVGWLLYYYLLAPRLDRFYENYVEAEYDSSGALIRLAMNSIPAILFLLYRKRFPVSGDGRAIWTLISFLALGLVGLVFFSTATTAIDRIGLYCIPLQLFVFGNIASVISDDIKTQRMVAVSIIGYYAAVLYIWLNYATHSEYWLPYQFVFMS